MLLDVIYFKTGRASGTCTFHSYTEVCIHLDSLGNCYPTVVYVTDCIYWHLIPYVVNFRDFLLKL